MKIDRVCYDRRILNEITNSWQVIMSTFESPKLCSSLKFWHFLPHRSVRSTTPQSSVTGASPNLTVSRYGRLNDTPYTHVHRYYHLTVVCFCIVAQTVCDCLLSLALYHVVRSVGYWTLITVLRTTNKLTTS